MFLKALFGTSILLSVTANVVAGTIIHAGRLINGHDGEVHQKMTVEIDEGRIVRVVLGKRLIITVRQILQFQKSPDDRRWPAVI